MLLDICAMFGLENDGNQSAMFRRKKKLIPGQEPG